jgi:glutaredoxin 3
MYANGWCPYCSAARALLRAKGANVTEIDIEAEPARRTEMIERSGRRTVPQIFVGSRHVGGYDDLAALDRAGGLDPLLAGNG